MNSIIKIKAKQKQYGVYTVEFAIVGSVFFLLFFSAIEISRLFFTWNVLTEVSRRGARLATVCSLLTNENDLSSLPVPTSPPSRVVTLATFSDMKLIPNLSSNNLKISYLQSNGSNATQLANVHLVRAEIVNYQHDLLIPGLFITLNSPSFSTTLPAESLGATRWKYTSCSD